MKTGNTGSKLCRIGIKISLAVFIAETIVFIALYCFITVSVTSKMKTSAVNNLQTAAIDRSEIIENYVQSAENTLTSYLKAGQIYDALSDPTNAEYAAAVQKYTEDFSKDVSALEGIYVCTWDTTVLAHTNSDIAGVVLRPDEDKRNQLHEAMLSSDVYNAGIIISPASGDQIISMYKAVKDSDGNVIGYGGLGIYTTELTDKLNGIPLTGLESSEYVLVNAQTGEYIFNPESEKVATVAEETYVNDIISAVKDKSEEISGKATYKHNGVEYIATYNSISSHDWVLIVSDKTSEVYSAVSSLKLTLFFICFFSAILLACVAYVVINHSILPINVVKNAITKLGNIHLDSKDDVEVLTERKDEIGEIAVAAAGLCDTMKNATDDVVRVLTEMADRNFTVDIESHRAYYIGDFEILADKLEMIKSNFAEVMKEIYNGAEQVDSGAGQVSDVAQTLSQGAVNQTESIERLADKVNDIQGVVTENAEHCAEATSVVGKTSAYVDEVNEKMRNLTEAMQNINDESEKIKDIVKSIEDIAFQTNILALNAAIEAARAGEAGKGFAVVADEVRNLAAKSAEAVNDTVELIDRSVEAAANGSQITRETADSMQSLDEYTLVIKKLVDNISAAGARQTEMVSQVNDDINQIEGIVQSNSATAEESAAAAEELSGQADTLKNLIGMFRI